MALPAATWVTSNPGTYFDALIRMVRSGSSVYLAGYGMNASFVNQGRIEKRNFPASTLDPVFGSGGVLTIAPDADHWIVSDLLIQGSALYTVSYKSATWTTATRIEKRDTVTGALDTAFGTAGVVTLAEQGATLASHAGALYVVGSTGTLGNRDGFIEKRDLATGALDPGFGSGGRVTQNISPLDDRYIFATTDGTSLWVSGAFNGLTPTASSYTALLEKRDAATGAIDGSFASGGVLVGGAGNFGALTLAGGDLYVGGDDYSANTTYARAQIRKLAAADGSAAAWASAGIFTRDSTPMAEQVTAMLEDAGSLYALVYLPGDYFNTAVEVLKLGTGGALDPGFAIAGVYPVDTSSGLDVYFSAFKDGSDLYLGGFELISGMDSQWRVEQIGTGPLATYTATRTVSPTPTPGGCSGQLGDNGATSNSYDLNNFIRAQRISSPGGYLATGLEVKLMSFFGGPVNAALYSDAAGSPGTLLVSGVAQTAVGGVQVIPIAPTALPAGDYWLAVMSYNASFANYLDYSTTPGASAYAAQAYGAFPASFPAGTAEANKSYLVRIHYVCGDFSPTPSFTPSPALSATPTASPTATRSETFFVSATPSRTASETRTVTSTLSSTPVVTPTASPSPGGCGNFGVGSPLGTWSPTEGTVWLTRQTLAAAMTVRSLHVYNQASSGNFRVAIYSNVAGNTVGGLLVESGSYAAVQGWNTALIPDTVLAAGDYWLGLQSTGAFSFHYGVGGTSKFATFSQTYAPFPASVSAAYGTYQFSIFASSCGGPAYSPTVTLTHTPAVTATPTRTHSATHTVTPVVTYTPTRTATRSFSASPTPLPNSIPEAVDNLALGFSLGGNSSWFNQATTTYSGGDAAQSGDIADSQSVWMETTVTGPGTLSFWWMVNSESGWDYLRVYVNGVDQGGGISGSVAWAQRSLVLAAGVQTVRWTYSKDGSVSTGSDAGYVDAVVFTPAGSPTISPTHSATPTITLTHTISPTFSVSPTRTATRTISATYSPSPTVSPSLTPCGGAAAALPYNEGFEGGSAPCGWSTLSAASGRVRYINAGLSGAYSLVLDSSIDINYGTASATFSVDASGGGALELRFRVSSSLDEVEALPSSTTTLPAGDGIMVSADGVTWHRAWQGQALAPQNVSVDLSSVLASAGLGAPSNLRIRFVQYDNYGWSTDGYAYDDIYVGPPASATSTPTRSVTRTATRTASLSPTATVTRTATPTPSITPSFTISPTFSVSPTVTPTPERAPARPGQLFSYPNPFKPGAGRKATFVFEACANAQIELWDWAGRRRGAIDPAQVQGIAGYAVWDGALADTDLAPPGLYFAVLRGDCGVQKCKLTVVWR